MKREGEKAVADEDGTLPHSETSTSSPRDVKERKPEENAVVVRKVDGVNLLLPRSGKSWEEELEFDNYLLFYSLSKSSLAKLSDIKKASNQGIRRGIYPIVWLCHGGKISWRKAAAIKRALTTRLGTNNNLRGTTCYLSLKSPLCGETYMRGHTTNEFKMIITYHAEDFICKG